MLRLQEGFARRRPSGVPTNVSQRLLSSARRYDCSSPEVKLPTFRGQQSPSGGDGPSIE